uniref:NADH dehydrogenase subunit 2 n=1 Tax=Planoprotostelium fungivorum TaxID=1890364 RepID=A0A290YM15_9EUKA|nr:NADH dehydrogenase subunit 2 [Planoprotostelium fungivorum]
MYWGAPHGGTTLADFTFLLVVATAGVAGVVLQGRPHGVEQLLLGGIAVGAGWATLHTDHLVVLYLNLELQALALYTLVGYHRHHTPAMDAALRYLLAGSLVSGFTLYGFVGVYLHTGGFTLGEGTPPESPWITAMVLFKLGAFPFWFWTPPVYDPLDWGTLALVVGPAKVNLWWLATVGLAPVVGTTTVAVAAVGSVVVGAVGGYFQVTAAGVLAYSGVINAGYLLVLTWAGTPWGVAYYLGVYLVGTALVVAVASPMVATGVAHLSGWVALGAATPLLLYYGVLNLGGLPVWPGFFGKIWLVTWGVTLGWGLVVVVVAASILPAVYYVGLAVAALFEGGRPGRPGRWSPLTGVALTLGGTALVASVTVFVT